MIQSNSVKKYFPHSSDWLASVVVFIVALPLTLGIAMASGVSVESAIISAIIGGIMGGLLAGSPLTVTGPAAGLAAIVFQIVQEHGVFHLALIGALAGLIQVLFGALRLGHWFKKVPLPVLEGTLAAIGLLIGLSQLHVLLGASVPKSPLQAILTLPTTFSQLTWVVASVALAAIAIQLAWPKIAKKMSWMPAALPAVLIVTLVTIGMDGLNRVNMVSFADSVGLFFAQAPSQIDWSRMSQWITLAFGLALVASAESLLTAQAVGKLGETKGVPNHVNLNRELFAQGMSNMTSSVLGGMPVTGVIVRSAANVHAGGRTRWSAILHGVWILMAGLFLTGILNQIPLAVLASILVLTGIKLLNIPHLKHLAKTDRESAGIWIMTMIAILATDLLSGFIISLVMAFAIQSKYIRNTRLRFSSAAGRTTSGP